MNKETIVVMRALCAVLLLVSLFYAVMEEDNGERVFASLLWELPETGKNDKAFRPSGG